jgi:hypothetical protein
MHTSSESRRLPISQEFSIDEPAPAENDESKTKRCPRQTYTKFNWSLSSSGPISDTPAQSTALAKTDVANPNLPPIQSFSKSKQLIIFPEIRIDEPAWKKAKTDASARSHDSSASAEVPRPSKHYEHTFGAARYVEGSFAIGSTKNNTKLIEDAYKAQEKDGNVRRFKPFKISLSRMIGAQSSWMRQTEIFVHLRSLRHLSILLYARKRKTQFCSLL